MKKKIAPVIVFGYNRTDHLKQTLEALENNYLANETEVFLFVDGPKNPKDELIQKEMFKFLLSKKFNFKKFDIKKYDINKGLANSIIDGVSRIINEYEKAIVLEDDLVTSKHFLEYINEALEFYEKQDRVWSISGYLPPINLDTEENFTHFFLPRASSWGWGTWKNRWEKIDWEVKDFNEFFKNKKKVKEFELGGKDLSYMLKAQVEKRQFIDSWAIRWCYSQYKNNSLTLFPKFSMVKNIGIDGSGTHSNKNNFERWNVSLLERDRVEKYQDKIVVNEKIAKEYRKKVLRYKFNYIILTLIDDLKLYNVAMKIKKMLKK